MFIRFGLGLGLGLGLGYWWTCYKSVPT